jgi:hypothetical protein
MTRQRDAHPEQHGPAALCCSGIVKDVLRDVAPTLQARPVEIFLSFDAIGVVLPGQAEGLALVLGLPSIDPVRVVQSANSFAVHLGNGAMNRHAPSTAPNERPC